MKIIAVVGLLYSIYCAVQVIAKWQYRNATEKGVWFVQIVGIGGWCLYILFG